MQAGTLTKEALSIIQKNGQEAIAQARQNLLQTKYDGGIVGDALHYYAENMLPNILPIFPALICLSSKAAGATKKTTNATAAFMLLITASGDIHDDIVDNSTKKFGKETLVGKFGKDIALLAGDALLTHGLTSVQKECDILPRKRKLAIADLITSSMFEIIKAEALENSLWRKKNVTPKEYFGVIGLKGGVAELHCKVGGLIGGRNQDAIARLGSIGKTIGLLSTIKEEYVDLSNPIELIHRLKHELPPYPMLYAMQEKAIKTQIEGIIKKTDFSAKDMNAVARIALSSLSVRNLEAELREYGRKELENNLLIHSDTGKELALIIMALSYELTLV